MAHQIEIVGGKASMAYFGEKPWHGLGQVLSADDAKSVELTIAAANLDWNVEKVPVQTSDDQKLIENLFAIRREHDKRVYTIATERYNILQNRQSFDWFQPFLDTNAVTFETAGSLFDGAVIFILAKMAGAFKIAEGDEVEQYLLLQHSHNGKHCIDASDTPVRVVCNNTLSLANNSKSKKVWGKIKHSKTMLTRLENVRDQIAESKFRFAEYMELYKQLTRVQAKPAQVQDYYKTLMGKKDVAYIDLPKQSKDRLDKLEYYFSMGKGNTNPAIAGTWWAAYNGYTEFLSHDSGRSLENRYADLWFNGADNQLALDTALAMVG